MNTNRHPFDKRELLDGQSDEKAETARAAAMAGQLERLARTETIRPHEDFVDRTWAAITAEPMPAPATAAGSAIRRRSLRGLVGAIVDAVRVAFGTGRPALVRGQAFALLFIVVLVALSIGSATAVGAVALFSRLDEPENHVVAPSSSPSPTASISPVPSPAPATGSPSSMTSPVASGSPAAGSGGAGATAVLPGGSFQPNETPTAGGTSEPSNTPRPTDTPKPSRTPKPSDTPRPTQTSGSGGGSGASGGS
jgi:hypothetical protein